MILGIFGLESSCSFSFSEIPFLYELFKNNWALAFFVVEISFQYTLFNDDDDDNDELVISV